MRGIAILAAIVAGGLLAVGVDGDLRARAADGARETTSTYAKFEREDCRHGDLASWGIWREHDYGRHSTIEWNTTAGPTTIYSQPSFRCLRIHAMPATLPDFETREWCAPLGIARVSWTIESGTPPFRLTIGGIPANADVGYVEIPCETIRAVYADGPLPEHRTVALIARVEDSQGLTAIQSVEVGVVSGAPKEEIETIDLDVGARDIHILPYPWSYRLQESPSTPIGMVAVARYRAAGEQAWTYVTPLPPPRQSGCGYWCFASHANDLQPGVTYELQAAWMWNAYFAWYPGWSEWLEQETEQGTWWRRWTTPDTLRWSETQQFRTYDAPQLSAEATSDSLIVDWPAVPGRYEAMAFSPDWPGVVWVDPDYAYLRHQNALPDGLGMMASTIGGLPADTLFELKVQQLLPWSFHPAPAAFVQVRTLPGQTDRKRWADPSDIAVVMTDGGVRAEWTQQWPFASTGLTMYSYPYDHGRLERLEHRWILPAEPYPGEVVTIDRLGGRPVQVVYPELPPGTSWRLFIKRRPGYRSTWRESLPYICMLWEIRMPTNNPETHLDHYFHSVVQSESPGVSQGQIRSAELPPNACPLRQGTGE